MKNYVGTFKEDAPKTREILGADAVIAGSGFDMENAMPRDIMGIIIGDGVTDTLTNIMHLCEEYNIPFDEKLKLARIHFEEEK